MLLVGGKNKNEMEKNNITNIQFDGIDHSDYPDYSDAHIVSAECNGIQLTDDEIEELNEDSDFVHEKVIEFIF